MIKRPPILIGMALLTALIPLPMVANPALAVTPDGWLQSILRPVARYLLRSAEAVEDGRLGLGSVGHRRTIGDPKRPDGPLGGFPG
jgi:hypothetical protein